MSYESVPRWIREIPEHLETSEMCNEAVAQSSYAWRYVPDYFKTQEMCNDAVSNNPAVLFLVPNCFKTQDMCVKALEVEPWNLYNIPDNLKTQSMCDDAIKEEPSSLQFVSDWFVTQQQLDIWYDEDYWYHDDEIIEWYKGYQKRKTQKAKIKEKLLPIAWHPNRVKDRCMSEDEKRETEKLWK